MSPVRARSGRGHQGSSRDDVWLVGFMDYDLGYFHLETRVLEPLENPFCLKVLPMSPVRARAQVVPAEGIEPTT
jgi:hypothetical protein